MFCMCFRAFKQSSSSPGYKVLHNRTLLLFGRPHFEKRITTRIGCWTKILFDRHDQWQIQIIVIGKSMNQL